MIELGLIASVDHHLRDKADRRPEHLAFHDAEEAVSYRQLDDATRGLTTALADLGVAGGQRVAVFMPNGVRWVVAALGIVRRGAVMVPIAADSSDDEATYRLKDAGCVAVIAPVAKLDQLARCCREAPSVRHLIIDGLPDAADAAPLHGFERLVSTPPRDDAIDCDDLDRPSFLLYPSGTISRAKGVLLTQRGLLWVIAACLVPIAGLNERDHVLSPLPLVDAYGLVVVLLGTLAVGATARLMTTASPADIRALLATGEFTVLPGGSPLFRDLLEHDGAAPFERGNLRLCIVTEGVLPAGLEDAFETKTGVPLLAGYGSMETSTFVAINAPGRPHVAGACGVPIPGLAVRVVDAVSRKDVPPGGDGELIVRGPNVMLGYHARPEDTEKALVDGWYLTGERARLDANGILTITGRL